VRLELPAPEAGKAPPAQWADEAALRLLKVLIAAELPVIGFRARELDLEDAFLNVTKGRVA
jgi:hypothetical protein